MLFQQTKKKSQDRNRRLLLEDLIASSGSFPAELSLITEEKRLIKVAVFHLQQNRMEDAGKFFVLLFPFWEARDLKVRD